MAWRMRREACRWLLVPGLIASLSSAAAAQSGFHQFLNRPYPVVRAALIKQGYVPLAQIHSMDELACFDDQNTCRKWPEVAEFTNAFERFMFVFRDRRHAPQSHGPRPLIVIANGTEFQVTAVRFANKDDREALAFLALNAMDDREQGLPTWEDRMANLHSGGSSKTR